MAAAVLAVAACSSSAAQPTVSVYQTRSDMPLDKIEIQVRNPGPELLTVQRAELVSSRFVASAIWDEDVEIRAGSVVDLKVQMPGATCVDDPQDRVVLTLANSRRITVEPDDPLGQLDKYSRAECFVNEVASTATVAVQGLRGDRLLILVDPGQVAVGELGTTILFRPVQPDAVSARPGQAGRVREAQLRPNRCDAHALAEDKQGTFFPVAVTLPDGRTGEIPLTVDKRTRGGLYRLYARLCDLE